MKTFLLISLLTLSLTAHSSPADITNMMSVLRPQSVAAPFDGGRSIVPRVLYKALPQGFDWRRGYTTIFVGKRLPQVPFRQFVTGMGAHVLTVTRAMAPRGLRGYVFAIVGEREIAFQNWTSKADCDAAFATEAGKEIGRQAGTLLQFETFEESRDSADWLNSIR